MLVKALSIRQPWAWLIVHGHKNIENRTWTTKHRGPLLIHASKRLDRNDVDAARAICRELNIDIPDEADFGGFVGIAQMVDVVHYSPSPWFNGPIGFVLADAQPIPFVDFPGKLGLFDVPDHIQKCVLKSTMFAALR